MGLLPDDRPASWYDPGRFWSGDHLELVAPFKLGGEIAVSVPESNEEPPEASPAADGPEARKRPRLRLPTRARRPPQ
jgi:hypothetical protein